MRRPRRIPSQLTFLAAGLAGTFTAILLAVMASLLPGPARTYASQTYAAGRERAQVVVLPTVQIVAQRN